MTNTVNSATKNLAQAWNGRYYSDPAKVPPEGTLHWRDPAAWPGGVVPTASTDAVIEAGTSILLDCHAVFNTLVIEGQLLVRNGYDNVSLTGGMIHGEDGGEFLVGESLDPYRGRFRVIFNGAMPASPLANTGHERSYMIHDTHKFHVYAVSPDPYVRLGASATASATSLTLASTPNNWAAANELVISSTGYYGVEAFDKRILASDVSSSAAAVTAGLSSSRWGVLQYLVDAGVAGTVVNNGAAGWSLTPGALTIPSVCDVAQLRTTLDERAFVANITRGVTFESVADNAWTTDKFGFHIMIMSLDCDVFVDGAEFLRGGQQGHMGRYPIHWHMLSWNSGKPNGSQYVGIDTAYSISSALSLTIPGGTTMVFLEALTGSNIRYTTDGSTPTASVGTLVAAGGKSFPITSWTAIKVIQVSANGGLKANYTTGDGAYLGDIPPGKGVVRNCVFRDCSQRAVVVHGTCGTLIEYNTVIDCVGHALFLEDGSERRNIFRHNLIMNGSNMPDGVLTNGWPKCLQDHERQTGPRSLGDRTGASGLWLTNPDNEVYGNFIIGYPGTGTWNAFPYRPKGLSSMVEIYPQYTRSAFQDNYNFGNGLHGAMTHLNVVDSIANAGVSGLKYTPTSDDQPTGENELTRQVRFSISFQNIKNGEGYFNITSWPNYDNTLSASNLGLGFSGVTHAGGGPVDGITGLNSGVIYNFVNSGLTLNTPTRPTGRETDYSAGMATYHGTLVPHGGFFVNYPWRPESTSGPMRPSGAIAWTDIYLEGQVYFTKHMDHIRLINTNFGNHLRPPFITGATQGTGKTFSSAIRDYTGVYGGTAGKTKTYPDANGAWSSGNFFSYDAKDLENAPGGTPGQHGYLMTNHWYSMEIRMIDGQESGLDPDEMWGRHIEVIRLNTAGTEVGRWIIPSGGPLIGDHVVEVRSAVMQSFFAVPQGNTEMSEVILDAGTINTSMRMSIDGLFDSTDVVLVGIKMLAVPSTASISTGSTVTLSPAANKAAVKAGTGDKYWYDSVNHVFWVKLVGQPAATVQQTLYVSE